MPYNTRKLVIRYLILLVMIIMTIHSSYALAANQQTAENDENNKPEEDTEFSIEIGALTVIGTDLRISSRIPGTPLEIGIRYLDIDDDFINEGAAGFPNDQSDRRYTTRTGLVIDYLFGRPSSDSFYVSGAFYNTNMKIECENETDSTSVSTFYFGGGYRRQWQNGFGFRLGILMSPFVDTKLETSGCSEEGSGDVDLNLNITYTFK